MARPDPYRQTRMSSSRTPSPDAAAPLEQAPPAAPRRPQVYRAAGHPLTWLLHLAVVATVATSLVLRHRPDPAGAVRIAEHEIQSRLDAGERVLRQAAVVQRHWWDAFRPTHGLLAATNHRLLFAGVAPPPLGSRGERTPRIGVLAFPYDTAFTIRAGRVFFGMARGAILQTRTRRQEFIAAGGSGRSRVHEVGDLAIRRVAAYREYQRREQRWRDSVLALPPLLETYRVQRGDALINVARRFDLTPERLREMNDLPDDRVRVGQTLIVKVTARQPGTCPREVCGPGPEPP